MQEEYLTSVLQKTPSTEYNFCKFMKIIVNLYFPNNFSKTFRITISDKDS